MANDPTARADPPEPVAAAAGDYEAFGEVLSASARGRAFLAEHARRSRSAETRTLMASLNRIEALVQANTPAADPFHAIAEIVAAIRSARPVIAADPLPARAAKLARLLDVLERRLAALAAPAAVPEPAPAGRRLAAVPAPAEPELPIPSPRAASAPPVALAPARNSATAVPDLNWSDIMAAPPAAAGPPAPARGNDFTSPVEARMSPVSARHETPLVAAAVLTLTDAHRSAPATASPAPPADPLSTLRLLSEAERIALFT
jgi:hypothetical protein